MSDPKIREACPFCGRRDMQEVAHSSRWDYFVRCVCHAVGPNSVSRQGAIDAWNARPEPAQTRLNLEECDDETSVHVTRHGMHYRCESCGYETIMWLEKGLEEGGPTQKPVPFTIKCNACGEILHGMRHVAWNEDARLPFYRPILDGWNYFRNDPDHECGIPVFAKKEGEWR